MIRSVLEQAPDLRSSLRAVLASRPVWPERDGLKRFALRSLGVKPDQFESWYRPAWWGHHAAMMLFGMMRQGRIDEILELVDAGTSYEAVGKALAAGRGAILLATHFGPGHVPPYALKKAGFRAKSIALLKYPHREANAEDYIFVTTPEEQKTSMVRAVKHLRQGGVLVAAPTGQVGEAYMESEFLGFRLKVFLGISEIARLSGAPVLWSSASWTAADRLRLIFEELPGAAGSEQANWRQTFYEPYFARFAAQARSNPADLGFTGGIWEEIAWYEPPR